MENLEVNKTKQVTENKEKVKDLKSDVPQKDSETELFKKELQDKLQALEQKEKEIARKEMELKLTETLNKNGLPQQLSKYLNIEGVEDVESYIKEVKEVLNIQLSNANTYKPNAHKGQTEGITKEQFNKMSYVDRLNLFKTNEELYKQLSK